MTDDDKKYLVKLVRLDMVTRAKSSIDRQKLARELEGRGTTVPETKTGKRKG